MSGKAKKVLTFSEQCAQQLKGVDTHLDRVYQALTVKLRQLGFALHPKWSQEELLREEGATRYITRVIFDKHGHCRERANVWLDFSVMPGDEPNVAVCSVRFQLEQFAQDDDPSLSSLPRIIVERKRDIVWPDQGSAVWLFAGHIMRKREELVDEFCHLVLAAISP